MTTCMYTVSIPIQPAIHQSVSIRTSSELADGLEIKGWLRVRSHEGKTFLDLDVTASNREDAIGTALSRVDDLLYLLTLYRDHPYEAIAFDIRVQSRGAVSPAPSSQAGARDIRVEIVDSVELSEKVAVHKRLDDISVIVGPFVAFRRLADETLRRALSWNHLAACSNDRPSAFLGRYVALELMLGQVSRRLDPNQVAAHLSGKGIATKREDISKVKRVRNALVHEGNVHASFDEADLVLRRILDGYLMNYIACVLSRMEQAPQ